jgi:rhamnosyl/mannosyltransferase
MKILQLGKFYPVKGGVEKVMYDLTQGLSEKGIYCDMMCTVEGKTNQIIRLNDYGKILGCKTIVKIAATTLSFSMIHQLKKICRQYDIIHIHHPDPMACVALFLSGYKGKIIVHWHSDILKQKLLFLFYAPFQNRLLKKADRIVGTTPVYVRESPHLQEVQEKVTFLPIGVKKEIAEISAVQKIREQFAGKKIVFSLGRLVDYKGFKYLIEAAAYLPDDYMILIGGEGPLKETLQAQINHLNLASKVILLGFISDSLKPVYYAACDIFCISSIQKTEAFAIVQIEAMSYGKPIVATKIPESGVAWVNKNGESGINCEPENGKAIATAVLEIFADDETYKKYSNNAKNRYQSLFTFDKMIENCMEIYKGL